MNNASIDGYLVSDPNIYETELGKFVVIRIKNRWKKAISETEPEKELTEESEIGEFKILSQYMTIDIICPGPLAEYACTLKRGDKVGVVGTLTGRTYATRGTHKYTIQLKPHHLWGINTHHANKQIMQAAQLVDDIKTSGVDIEEPFI